MSIGIYLRPPLRIGKQNKSMVHVFLVPLKTKGFAAKGFFRLAYSLVVYKFLLNKDYFESPNTLEMNL